MRPSTHIVQIDLLKAFAIIGIIILHTYPANQLEQLQYKFHIAQSVPLFLAIFGFNYGRSLKKTFKLQTTLYPKYYFVKFFKRIIAPFWIIALPVLAFFILKKTNGYDLNVIPNTLLGFIGSVGPGNYFVTILFQLILLFPFLYKSYQTRPKLTLFASFIINLGFELMAPNNLLILSNDYLYKASVFRYLFVITLGIWISDNRQVLSRKNLFILVGSFFSIIYLITLTSYFNLFGFLHPGWRNGNLFSSFYIALLVLLSLKYFPSSYNRVTRFFSRIGLASYYIFLIQMVYFTFIPDVNLATWPENRLYQLLINLIVCITLGISFQNLLNRFHLLKYRSPVSKS